ncbi:hypothetical protein ACTQ6A_07580 [Lachnospiraceae bacterium LCP25S3_G4]
MLTESCNNIQMKFICMLSKEDKMIYDKETFYNIITASKIITMRDDNFYLEESLILNQEVKQIENPQSSERFFVIQVASSEILTMEKFRRELNTIFKRIGIEFILLSDGISRYYSEKAYLHIYDIENLMRHVITDFIFTEFSKYSSEQLMNEMKKKEFNREEFTLLQKKLPRSNWDLYFRPFLKESANNINMEKDEIQSIWNNLYPLRNKIAHGNEFSKNDYDKLMENKQKIEMILNNILRILENNFGDIATANIDMDEIKNIYIATSNPRNMEFINIYNDFSRYFESLTQLELEKLDSDEFKNENELVNVAIEVKKFKEKLLNIDVSDDEVFKYVEIMKLKLNQYDEDSDIDKGWDTILVPARKEGFEKVFLKEGQWYDIRINDNKKDNIKYIAAYQTKPISAITHWAEVDNIVDSDNYLGYKKILFKGKAQKLDHYIELDMDKPNLAPQSIRYISMKKIKESNYLSEVIK